jgi:hypothetical protein
MSYVRILLLLTILSAGSANADVWLWVDSAGETHFVETNRPIFTWVDKSGKAFYSDKPDHEDAVLVQLVWVSDGTIEDMNAAEESPDDFAYEGETSDERAEREEQEAHFCKRATEIYDSYVNAPRLYRTNDDGEREYLSKKEAEVTMQETRGKVDDLCQ